MPLTRDVSKVLVGEGALYVAPENTTKPADTVALFAGWSAPWVHPGLTNEGVNVSFERDLTFHRVEEQSTPVFVSVGESSLSFATALVEDVLDNLKTAMGGGTLVTTAAASGQIGKKEFSPSDVLDIVAVGFEALNPFGFFRRMYVPRAVSVETVEMGFRRSEEKRMFGASFQSMAAMADIDIWDKTANALA